MKHAGLIRISNKLLLEMLDFKGGIIHRVFTPEEFLDAGYCVIVLEHPDLPKVEDNEKLPEVQPVFQVHYAEQGGIIKVERLKDK